MNLVLEGQGKVVADAVMVDRVVSNLLSNALRYAPAGTTIKVNIWRDESTIQLAVQNAGPAISAEHVERIFDRFYRVDPARREGSGNSGLGLAIARSLMQAHGGQISCQSNEHLTTFTLVFPRQN